MSPRKSVDHELTKEMIMDTARELFAEQGFQHVSMRKIAQSLGYSHGALYYHFKNKAEIFYSLVFLDFSSLNHEIVKVMNSEADNDQKIRDLLLRFIKFGLDHPNHYEIMFLTRDEEVQSFLQQEPSESYRQFSEALHQLSNRTIPIKETWSVFLSLHGFVSVYLRNRQSYSEVEIMAETHVDVILRAIVQP
ncbi:TetR/AcrR family transcriptional regulator [Peribacillus huizhouensis]|uniref:AcrR family transcriptional regulator n=1 Tax=Peribacillus huizhouensis TaxID=1501239 RepID=A0ABR6CNH3_9BACI|nr:TetR/AcrR family transcriptional regulator [Peribacillus huizhouensis]MBA9026581.1 AcrR family transcriptional regulator [Peribacillus huizhouensis]